MFKKGFFLSRVKELIEDASVQTEVKELPLEAKIKKNSLIDQIHNEFYSEVDKLLQEAGIKVGISEKELEIKKKSEKLMSLGFLHSKVHSEKSQIDRKEHENKEKDALIESINYFSMKYPNYKFITHESVKKICSKYNLVIGSVEIFIGDVPDKNLEQMTSFRIENEDKYYLRHNPYSNRKEMVSWDEIKPIVEYPYSGASDHPFKVNVMDPSRFINIVRSGSDRVEEGKLSIVAPVSDFQMSGKYIHDSQIVSEGSRLHQDKSGSWIESVKIEDPIVLCPVQHNGRKYYLIVTAWGQEALDPLVVNQKFN